MADFFDYGWPSRQARRLREQFESVRLSHARRDLFDDLVQGLPMVEEEMDRLRAENAALRKAGNDLAAAGYELSNDHAQHCPCQSAEHRTRGCRVATMNESRTRWGNVTAALNAPSEVRDV